MPLPSGFPTHHHQCSINFKYPQNTTLRVATGYVKITSIDYNLSEKIKVIPVYDHLSLLCSQYLVRTLQSNNRFRILVTSSSGFRNMKQNLQSIFLSHCALDWNTSGGFEFLALRGYTTFPNLSKWFIQATNVNDLNCLSYDSSDLAVNKLNIQGNQLL